MMCFAEQGKMPGSTHGVCPRRCRLAVILAAAVFLLGGQGAIAGTIYWSDLGGTIHRANDNGSSPTTLVSGLAGPYGLAVDGVGGRMYWTNPGTSAVGIQSASLDGSGVQTLVQPFGAFGIDIDPAGAKLYVAISTSPDSIRRANLNGTGLETLVTAGLSAPQGIALDVVGGKMYWTDLGNGNGTVNRANLDGTDVETLVNGGLQNPTGIELDLVNGKIYWVDSGNNIFRRANLDGSGVETLFSFPTSASSVLDIALDVSGGKIYWADSGLGRIRRSNFDGTGLEDLVNTPVGGLRGIDFVPSSSTAVIPEPASLGCWLAVAAACGLFARRKARAARGSQPSR